MSSGFSFDDYLLALHRCSPSAVRQNIVNAFPLFEIRPELLAVVINRLEWRKAIAAYDVARVQMSHILTHEHHREYTKALCFSGNWLWAMMHASKDVKDRERIDCAIMCCGNSGQWRRAMKLLFKSQELTEKAGPSPVHGEATWLNATRIAVQASPFSKALREGIVRSLLSMRNTVAIASIVLTATQKWSATTIHNHPINSSFAPTREEMHALLAISNDALLPQLHSFNASIQWSHVLKLASTFLSQGFGRTHNVLQSLINALDIRGRWVECLETVTWYRKQASISLLHESFMIPIWTSRALPEAGKSVVLILHVYKKALESRGPQFARPLGIMAARACDDLQAPGIANEIRQTITPYSRKRILRVKQCKN